MLPRRSLGTRPAETCHVYDPRTSLHWPDKLLTDWRFIFEKWILGKHRATPYEPKVSKVLRQFRGKLFVDIGANQGIYSILLARNFEKVYAFEPNPQVASILRGELAKRRIRNVRLFQTALADRNGRTILFLDPHVGFGGSADTILPVFEYKPNPRNPNAGPAHVYKGTSGIEVQMATYDSAVGAEADLVKIDVEGAEFMVLEGMSSSIVQGKVKRVLVELHNTGEKSKLEKTLSGFRLKWIDGDHLLATRRT